MKRILSIFGTRPEAIKMAPVLRELGTAGSGFASVVCVTAQHRQMLDQVLRIFGIEPDLDCDLMETDQTLAGLTARALLSLDGVLEKVRPDLVLVQGDTTTAMVAGLAAFYHRVPVGHVEAGLRTGARFNPFPEEIYRRLLGTLSTYHFAPTQTAAEALRQEGIPGEFVFVTGNTVVDALLWVRGRPPSAEAGRLLVSVGLGAPGAGPRTIVVTAHRRESFGEPLREIVRALRALVERNSDVQIVFPVHLNPNVQQEIRGGLEGVARIHLVDPLPYDVFVHLMDRAHFLLTDSGGLQEEAPSLGKPVLVMREETERPEGVIAGLTRLVGARCGRIVEEAERLLRDEREYRRMVRSENPYGDGQAAERIVGILAERLGAA